MEKSNFFVLRSHTTWQVGLSRETSIQALLVSLVTVGFPGGLDGKESACNVGDRGSIPGLGRSPGEGNDNPLQYCCLENTMDRGAWQAPVHGVTKDRTPLSDWHFHFHLLKWKMFTPGNMGLGSSAMGQGQPAWCWYHHNALHAWFSLSPDISPFMCLVIGPSALLPLSLIKFIASAHTLCILGRGCPPFLFLLEQTQFSCAGCF